jgi:glycosyltransferase involved in cell wall biosynthesis
MISVTVLAKNSQQYIYEVLSALQDFNEVLLYDTGSTDKTMEIAATFPNVTIVQAPFEGFGPTHNKASACAKNDWILSIDSDEIVSPELAKEILEIKLQEDAVYSFPRHNYYRGKWIKWCGWYPDRQYRLYNRTKTRFSDAQVHEAVIIEGMYHVPLKHPIKHYSYRNVDEFLSKMQSYSTLFAMQNRGKKRSSLGKAVCHGFFAFFKSYLLKRGFLGGREGFEIAVYNGNTAFYKYLKLAEK